MKNKKAFLYIIGFLAVVFVGFLVGYSTDSTLAMMLAVFTAGSFIYDNINDIIEGLKKTEKK